jgi:hypothetical protein
MIMTGKGAVGSPLIKPMRSGRAKKPDSTNNKKETLFKVIKSVKEMAPIITKIIPKTRSPTTKAKVSNMVTASADGSAPKASVMSIILNSGKKRDKNKGSPCIKISVAQSQKIVLIFISNLFIVNQS